MLEQLQKRSPEATAILAQAAAENLAFADFPKEHWRPIWFNNLPERLNRDIRRRTEVVSIFPTAKP